MPEFAVVTKFTVQEQLTRFFTAGERAANKFEATVNAAFKRSGKSASTFGQLFAGVTFGNLAADGIRRGAAAIKNLAGEGLELASNLIEVQNVVDTSFGPKGAAQVGDWSRKAMTAFGLSELQAKQFAGTMGAMLKSSGLAGDKIVQMSTRISSLAGDFASFYNLPIEEAFLKIRSGISGETEPLKQLGINMSVANMQAFALTQGIHKKWEKMKQAEQAELRYAYLMKVSADAQGDFSKTLATSYANQQRVLQTNIKAAAAGAMSAVLPLAMRFSQELNKITSRVGDWIAKNKDLIATRVERTLATVWWVVKNLGPPLVVGIAAFKTMKVVMLAAAAAGKIFGLVNTIMFAYQAVAQGAATKTEALNMVMKANPLGLICTVLSIAIGLFALLATKVGGVGPAFRVLGETTMKFLLAPLNLVIDGLQLLLGLLSKLPGLGKTFGGWKDDLGAFQDKLNTTLTGDAGSFDFADPYKRAREAQVGKDREAPNQAQVERMDSSFYGQLNIAGAPPGSTLSQQAQGPNRIRAELMGENP